jgi:pimeloyl-ACP methyl ester carboxylesterase
MRLACPETGSPSSGWSRHCPLTATNSGHDPVIAERLIDVNGAELCTESFGVPSDPRILLVMGLGASMLWWPEELCRLLAGRGRFVIRYDHRDTGRSTTYDHGHPGYTGADLLTDAVAVLDDYSLPAAHLVGVSAGGALVQLLALDVPDRVLSLVLISTSPAVPGDRSLPPPSPAFTAFVRSATMDWSDADSAVDYLVSYARVLAGDQRPFDEAGVRDLVQRDIARAHDFAALQNHELLEDDDRPRKPLSSIKARTLVIHGTADPMFPIPHGQALVEEITGARLLPLEGAGHGVQRAEWDIITDAIATHTDGERSPTMERSASREERSASEQIDERIRELGDWRGETLASVRELIKEADPEIVEEWKWAKASSPGTPVWSHNGLVCTGETYKNVVKLTFGKGASLKDPSHLFNSSLEGKVRRAIDIREGEEIDESALTELIREAVALNLKS